MNPVGFKDAMRKAESCIETGILPRMERIEPDKWPRRGAEVARVGCSSIWPDFFAPSAPFCGKQRLVGSAFVGAFLADARGRRPAAPLQQPFRERNQIVGRDR